MLRRIPEKQAVVQVFWSAVLPIHIWAVFAFLSELPGYILRFSLADILSVGAYVAVFALFESLGIVLFFVFLAFVLPAIILKDHFAAKSFSIIWLTSVWVIPVHAISFIHQALPFSISIFQIMIFLWVMSYFVSLLWSMRKIKSSPSFVSKINDFINRSLVLTSVYLAIDILSLLGIILRLIAISLERS